MEGSEYYESLIQQGYSSEQAEQYTAQHYPGFTAQKQMPVIQDSVVVGDLPPSGEGKDVVKDSVVINEEVDTEFLDDLL